MKTNKPFKAVLIALLLSTVLFANDNRVIETKHAYSNNGMNITIVQIKGHEYIITNPDNGGVCIIHSESCMCKE